MSDDIVRVLDAAKITFARILWCDNGNVIRGKAVHRGRLLEYLTHGVGISAAQQAVPVTIDAPADGSGLGPVGEVRLVPDLATLTMLPHALGHAQFMGDMVRDGRPWAVCPREFLRRMRAAAAVENVEVRAAFENEFYFLRETSAGIVPADNTPFASSVGMDVHREVIDAIAAALIEQGIVVEHYYPESGPGQQELTMLYTDAMSAADQQIMFRETVRAVARQHQLTASFVPKIFADHAGSGCHVHMSLWRDGKNVLPDTSRPGRLAPVGRHFMAGIVHHLPGLMAVTTPSPNSYRRIRPHCWSGAFQCWGVDNREAAVRVVSNPVGPSPTHFEVKTVDASANPYLALGALIAAGLDGLKAQRALPAPVDMDPGSMAEGERDSRGIRALPSNLGIAVEELARDDELLGALGSELARAFLAVRRTEWETMKDWTLDREVALLLTRY